MITGILSTIALVSAFGLHRYEPYASYFYLLVASFYLCFRLREGKKKFWEMTLNFYPEAKGQCEKEGVFVMVFWVLGTIGYIPGFLSVGLMEGVLSLTNGFGLFGKWRLQWSRSVLTSHFKRVADKTGHDTLARLQEQIAELTRTERLLRERRAVHDTDVLPESPVLRATLDREIRETIEARQGIEQMIAAKADILRQLSGLDERSQQVIARADRAQARAQELLSEAKMELGALEDAQSDVEQGAVANIGQRRRA
jgi:hypothetical protein